MSEISKINEVQKASFRRITKQKKNRSKRKVNNKYFQCSTEPSEEISYPRKHKKNRKKFIA